MEEKMTIGNKLVRATVDLSDGFTLTELSYKGRELVLLDKERRKQGATYAIPILFPTPNRVENLSYCFEGRRIDAVMHGFLRHEGFTLLERTETSIKAFVPFDGSNPLFPYKGRFTVLLEAEKEGLCWTFSIENQDEDAFSYSLALHPFFKKDGLRRIFVDVTDEMLNTEEKIPTGELRSTGAIDLEVDKVDMDTVFMAAPTFKAELEYEDFRMLLSASEDFRHVVVYSSPDKDFICIEPQTGSTDAHNLHAKGFVRQASLIILPAGKKKESFFSISFQQK